MTAPRHPLEERFYALDADERAFFTAETGITDDDALKQHIIAVQEKAYAIYDYPCILRFAFTKLKICRLFAYQDFLKLARERDGAIFLDVGCCFGNDIRKAVVDGWPVQNAIASDLRPAFWDLGHELFKSTPESFPVPFIGGDLFDPAFLAPHAPFTAPPAAPAPALGALTTLTPLHGRLSAIHASALFHLFPEAQQAALAHALAALLDARAGSLLFGSHGGLPARGFRVRPGRPGPGMFCHSPESWKQLWEEQVFGPGEVRVDARLVEIRRPDLDGEGPPVMWHWMEWAVTRL